MKIRTEPAYPEPKSEEHSHEPLGFQDVQPMSDGNEDDVKQDVAAESDTSRNAAVEFDDVHPMAVDGSLMKDVTPMHRSVQDVLPGGEESAYQIALDHDNTLNKASPKKRRVPDYDTGSEEEAGDDELNIFREKIPPQRTKSPPQSVGLKSVGHSKQPRSVAKKRVVFDRGMKENKQPGFDEEEYEAQNFVRLFNADRGRKGGATDVTDLDIALTNIEEIALEIKNKIDSAINKKVVREAFIQIRQIFSDTIDIYKEKKYLQSATTKVTALMRLCITICCKPDLYM